jgi:hypothetical protein
MQVQPLLKRKKSFLKKQRRRQNFKEVISLLEKQAGGQSALMVVGRINRVMFLLLTKDMDLE